MCSTWFDTVFGRDDEAAARSACSARPRASSAEHLDLADGEPGRALRVGPARGGPPPAARRPPRRRRAGRRAPRPAAPRRRGRRPAPAGAAAARSSRGRRRRRPAAGRTASSDAAVSPAGSPSRRAARGGVRRSRGSRPSAGTRASMRSVRYGCRRTRSRSASVSGPACPRSRWRRRAGRGRGCSPARRTSCARLAASPETPRRLGGQVGDAARVAGEVRRLQIDQVGHRLEHLVQVGARRPGATAAARRRGRRPRWRRRRGRRAGPSAWSTEQVDERRVELGAGMPASRIFAASGAAAPAR